jgi:hypothetical protein
MEASDAGFEHFLKPTNNENERSATDILESMADRGEMPASRVTLPLMEETEKQHEVTIARNLIQTVEVLERRQPVQVPVRERFDGERLQLLQPISPTNVCFPEIVQTVQTKKPRKKNNKANKETKKKKQKETQRKKTTPKSKTKKRGKKLKNTTEQKRYESEEPDGGAWKAKNTLRAVKPTVIEEDLSGDEKDKRNETCTCDHQGTVDFVHKLIEKHDLFYKLKGTCCMDCKVPYDSGKIIPSTIAPVSLCEGYMIYTTCRCRRSVCTPCMKIRLLTQEKKIGKESGGRPQRKKNKN